MAPKIKEVIEELEKRALTKGYKKGSDDFLKYIQPRNIPPMIIEDTIKFGKKIIGNKPNTWLYQGNGIQVVTNNFGDIITLYKRSGC